ncbi:MAG: mechanosensitive ion channel family protein [Prochloraceae cyanobacterium]|nr:mechanosensitive ion channel family protein [Prochloraceae cyanobacterium]
MLDFVDYFNLKYYSLVVFAQTNPNKPDNLSQIFSEITTFKVIQGVIIIAIAYGAMWATQKLMSWLSEKVPLRFRLPIKQSIPFWRAFILGFAIVLLIDLFLTLSANNVLALTGTVTVALGFAFKDYVSSVIAGIIGLFEIPYQVGDRVKIGEHYGEIVSYGLRGIMLQTPDDDTVTIPHNKLWTDAIANTNKGNVEAQTVIDFYLAHDVDIDRVIQILYRVARTSKHTQLKLPILVVIQEKPWGTHFKLKCYPIDARDEFIYRTDLTKRAKQIFAKYNISYPPLPAREFD